MNVKQKTLESGLRIILVPMESVKSVTAMALVAVGSRYEDKDKNGISHFLEHMVFKGTEKWPTAFDLSQAVDGIGAEFNAFTSKEYTGFYIKSASRHLPYALSVLSDMLYTPKLRPTDLEREKGVIVEEINMYNDLPQRKVADLFDKSMYGDVGLGRRIDGEKEIVKSFTRKDFVDHLEAWYGLDNTVLVISGDAKELNRRGLMDEIEEYFSKGSVYGLTTARRVLGFEFPGEISVTVNSKESDQAHFIMGFPGYSLTHPRRYALTLLSVIMGGNMSSRLFTEVREKRGLAYYSRIDVDRFSDTGSIAAVEGVDVNRVDEAMTVTLDVFEDVASDGKKGITEEELVRAKEYLAGSLILSLEGSRNMAQFWGMRAVLGDEVISPEEVLKKMRAVTREEVVAVAKELFDPKKLVFTIVGPFEDRDKFEQIVRFDR